MITSVLQSSHLFASVTSCELSACFNLWRWSKSMYVLTVNGNRPDFYQNFKLFIVNRDLVVIIRWYESLCRHKMDLCESATSDPTEISISVNLLSCKRKRESSDCYDLESVVNQPLVKTPRIDSSLWKFARSDQVIYNWYFLPTDTRC